MVRCAHFNASNFAPFPPRACLDLPRQLLCCEQLRSALPANPQLHAWWHVFVSGGLYTLSIWVAHEPLHQSPQIRHLCGWLPYVHAPPLEVRGRRLRLHEPPEGGAQGAQGARSRSRSPSPSRAKRK